MELILCIRICFEQTNSKISKIRIKNVLQKCLYCIRFVRSLSIGVSDERQWIKLSINRQNCEIHFLTIKLNHSLNEASTKFLYFFSIELGEFKVSTKCMTLVCASNWNVQCVQCLKRINVLWITVSWRSLFVLWFMEFEGWFEYEIKKHA